MMRQLLLLLIIFPVLAGCGSKEGQHPAALAAQGYYEKLKAGDYAAYVSGMAGADSIPQQYREQLEVNAKQFLALQKEEHKGIDSIRIVNTKDDSIAKYTNVFLEIQFADSLKEEIVVAMVKRGDRWLMK